MPTQSYILDVFFQKKTTPKSQKAFLSSYTDQARTCLFPKGNNTKKPKGFSKFESLIVRLPTGKLISSKFINDRIKINSKIMGRYFKELKDKGIITEFIKNPYDNSKLKIYVRT
jgi:hypothetical protein